MDGFNSKKFKATWSITKSDLVKVVLELFEENYMYDAVNCAIINFIPKTTNAKSMRDMRHIACCTTIYKIIFKILTVRLSEVINTIVDDSEFVFLPGKIIHDNIIMAHELMRGYNRKHVSFKLSIQMDIQKAYDIVE